MQKQDLLISAIISVGMNKRGYPLLLSICSLQHRSLVRANPFAFCGCGTGGPPSASMTLQGQLCTVTILPFRNWIENARQDLRIAVVISP
jgi:hypothetical protein